MNKQTLRASLLLLLTTVIWGAAFSVQRVSSAYLGAFGFNGIRYCMAGCLLLAVAFPLKRAGVLKPPASRADISTLLKGGVFCGLALAAASVLQQIGLGQTSAGKGGFITSMYVVLVPVASIMLGRRVKPHVWLCVLAAAGGLYLLCVNESFSVTPGDSWVMLCAVVFTAHILLIDRVSPKVDGVLLSCAQFWVAGLVCLVCALLFEPISIDGIRDCLPLLLYAGLLSGGVGYTLQVIAQKSLNPALASMIMCLESVFSVLFGALLLHETLTAREDAGCAIMFAAVICSQIPVKPRVRREKAPNKVM